MAQVTTSSRTRSLLSKVIIPTDRQHVTGHVRMVETRRFKRAYRWKGGRCNLGDDDDPGNQESSEIEAHFGRAQETALSIHGI